MACRRLHELCVPSIHRHSGYLLLGAEVLIPFPAEFTLAAAPVKPRYSDPVTHLQFMDCGAPLNYPPGDSCPRISGFLTMRANCVQSPSATCKSEWHTPQASTLIKTSPGSSCGCGTSLNSKGSLNSFRTAAFISIASARVCDSWNG